MIRTNKINQGFVRIENYISRIQVPESQTNWDGPKRLGDPYSVLYRAKHPLQRFIRVH